MYADGYKYWFAFKTDKTSYYRCCRYIRSKCPGKCTSEDGFIKQHNVHNHPPESNRILVDKFRKILTQRACAENTELYTIYCDEATNRHTDAALLYPFTSAESAMRKARRKQLPSCIPKTVDDIITELDNTDLFRVKSGNDRDPLHQKTITLENNAICMIFLHRKTINLFGRIDELHIDGSFEFIIENQSNYYLLTVHAIQGQITAPIVYAITTTKIKSSYIEIFKYIRDELKIAPNIIISDYDIIMQSSLKYIYPDTIIKGCWYHYTDAILMQVKNLNLKSELQRGNGASSLRMLLVLPLLPPEYMVPGIESIRKWMKEKLIFSDNLSILCNYIEYNWLKLFGTEKMSIFGTTRIASNHLKNFNRELSDLIGKQQNPIIWIILDSLTQLATKIYVKTTRKMRFLKHTINLQNNNNNNNTNNNDKLNNNYKQKTTTSIKCAPTINSFDLTKQSQLILPIPRTMKRSELVSETIITSATQLWIKTPVHLRNSLQFLQLISHCINDSMYLANLSDIKERNYLPSVASIENLKLAIDSTKNTLNNNNINNGNNSNNNINNNNNNSNINSINSDQETSQNIIMQSFILEDDNLGNNSSGSSCNNNNTQIIQMIENNHNDIVSTTNHWNNTNQLNDLQQQQSPSSPTLSFVLQEGTFNCTEITHQEYLLAQPGQAQQQNTYTSCFAQNNFNIDDLTNHHHHDDQQHHHQNNIIEMNNLQQEKHQMLQNDCQQQQQQSNNVFNFDDQHHQHLHHHIDHNNINSVEIRPMLQQQQQPQQIQQQQQQSNLPPAQIQQTEPPPLVFFKSVKRYPLKRILPVLSEPPPLVPINSAKRSLLTNKSSSQK